MNTKILNKLTFIAAAMMLFAVSGCKKYLDQQPITSYGQDLVFSNVNSATSAVVAAYSRLVGDAGFGIRLSLYYTVDQDEMQGPTGAGDNDRRDIARYNATSTNAQLTNPFNQLFQGIEYANICIENIPKMDMYTNGSANEQKQLRRLHGEALTLRAQFYMEAMMVWGDLPAHFHSASNQALVEQFPKKTDRDSIYDVLLNDLKLAEDLVPWRNELPGIGDNIDERITKGTVKGLRARMALMRGGWSLRQNGTMQRGSNYQSYYQIAKDECADIMNSGQHNLNSSFKGLWKDQVCAHVSADPDGELMFQASAFGLSGTEDTKLGYYNGPTVNGLGNKSINIMPTFFYLFDSTDKRRDVTCAVYNVAANGSTKVGQPITAICDGKYRRDWVTNPVIAPTNQVQYLGLKWQILRFSDVMLMYAEAENELNGPTTSAYDAINKVRRRGYGLPISSASAIDIPSGLTKAQFFQYIVRERSLELAGEGVRKFDLIRWNLLATAISETKANLQRMGAVTTPLVDPSYMAGYPSYCKVNNLPIAMYYFTTTTSDDNNIGGIWANSFYKPAPTTTPAGTTKVSWMTNAIITAGTTSPYGRFAVNFSTGKSELLPLPQPALDANANLKQNPGY